jgi:hypothetical protein
LAIAWPEIAATEAKSTEAIMFLLLMMIPFKFSLRAFCEGLFERFDKLGIDLSMA